MTLHEVWEHQKDQENKLAMPLHAAEYYVEIVCVEETNPLHPYYIVAWRHKGNNTLLEQSLGCVCPTSDQWLPYPSSQKKMTFQEIWDLQKTHEDKFAITVDLSQWYVEITPCGGLLDAFLEHVIHKKDPTLIPEISSSTYLYDNRWPFDVELEDKAWLPYTPTNLPEVK